MPGYLFSLSFVFAGLVSLIFDYQLLTVVFLLIASVSFAIHIWQASGNLFSLPLFFFTFFAVYGLSGPLHALTGGDFYLFFTAPYKSEEYLFLYSLGMLGCILAKFLYSLNDNSGSQRKASFKVGSEWNLIGILLLAMASLSELINFVRVGGLAVAVFGKATYQSAVGEMSLTLPSHQLYFVGLTAFCIGIVFGQVSKKLLITAAVASAPLLTVMLFLGMRGPIAATILVFLLIFGIKRPIKHIRPVFIILAFFFYFLMSFLTANRGIIGVAIATNDWSVMQTYGLRPQNILRSVNPATAEFGAAFGNTSEFFYNPMEFRFGETYINDLSTLIPGFLYPGEKPKQITYEFRDKYFPTEANRARIAGTGFSSLLEAYINFGYIGAFLVYFLVFYFLLKFNALAVQNPYFLFLYASMAEVAMSFHRSAFSSGLLGVLMFSFLGMVVVLFGTKILAFLNEPFKEASSTSAERLIKRQC